MVHTVSFFCILTYFCCEGELLRDAWKYLIHHRWLTSFHRKGSMNISTILEYLFHEHSCKCLIYSPIIVFLSSRYAIRLIQTHIPKKIEILRPDSKILLSKRGFTDGPFSWEALVTNPTIKCWWKIYAKWTNKIC